MSIDPNAQGPYAPQPPAKSGGSGIWLFLGIGCGLVLLLCCGGGVGLFYLGKQTFQIAQDPGSVKQQSSEITDLDVPENFKPEIAFTMNVPFTGQKIMTMVAYSAPNNEGGVILAGAGQLGAGMDRAQFKLQVDQQMNQQGRQMRRINVAESRDVEVEIRGQKATFQIQKGTDTQTNQQYIQVEGAFEGKQGPAMIMAQLKADDFTEDDAEKLVRSIK